MKPPVPYPEAGDPRDFPERGIEVSDVLEDARQEHDRRNVFIVTVQPWTLTARLYPGARWRGTVACISGGPQVRMESVGLEEKLAVTGALRLTLAAAFWPRGRK